MTATSHALTGTAIGLAISQPVLALSLAFISHFVCDAIPHFGLATYQDRQKHQILFHKILYIDAILLATLMLFLLTSAASWLVFACLFLAGSPDIIWAYRYVIKEDFGKKPLSPMNKFSEFHKNIQWSETFARGFFIELVYSVVILSFMLKQL